jgi:hypothetical protein
MVTADKVNLQVLSTCLLLIAPTAAMTQKHILHATAAEKQRYIGRTSCSLGVIVAVKARGARVSEGSRM